MKDEIIKDDEQLEGNDDVIQLVNEDGETIDFYHVGTIQYNEEWYVFFQPTEEFAEDYDEDYGDLVVFKLESDEKGEDLFTPVLDEKIREAVYDEYARLMGEEVCDCGCSGDGNDNKDGGCDCGSCKDHNRGKK